MKMKTNKIFPFLLLGAAFFQGCEQIVDLDSLKPDPKLVLNGVVKAGEPVRANLSRTWFYTDGKPNLTIPGADVKLYVNDVLHLSLLPERISPVLMRRAILLLQVTVSVSRLRPPAILT